MVFNVKLGENFRHKVWLVSDGRNTNTKNLTTYSSVLSIYSVKICLLEAALNNLNVQYGDIENYYLTAPCRENIWNRAGPYFEAVMGKMYIITKAIYGLKSPGAAFRAFLA